MEHPVLGKLKLLQGKNGPYWMHDSYTYDDPAISIDTVDEQPPSDEQVAFYQRIASDLDTTFARVAPSVVPEYEKWLKRPFPSNWRDAFTFAGIGIPLEGKEGNPWDLTFELLTDKLGYLYTCYFENGQLVHVGVDT